MRRFFFGHGNRRKGIWMVGSQYFALLAGYSAAMIGWLLLSRAIPGLWPSPPPGFAPQHPWREVGWALLAAAAVVGIGQLWGAEMLLPRRGLYEAGNQVVIYSPFLILLAIRRQPLSSAWLPMRRVWLRLLIGLGLALLSLSIFTIARAGGASWPAVIAQVYAPGHSIEAVQVFLEDVAIAIVFVRFAAALGARRTILLVAILFALAHIPAFVQSGVTVSNLGHLILDAGLGVVILSVLRRSADVWWFWMVHFAMDMSQFVHASA
jgi:hypothetical protein